MGDFSDLELEEELGFEEEKPRKQAAVDTTPPEIKSMTDGEKLSQGEAALWAAGQGASLGFFDELLGAIGAGKEALTTGNKFKDLYPEYRDAARKLLSGAEEEHPATMIAGELAGGLAMPAAAIGKLGKGATYLEKVKDAAKVGAAMGGITGAGGSVEDSALGLAKDVAIGAGMGATIGAGVEGVVAPAARAGTEHVKNAYTNSPVIGRILEAFTVGKENPDILENEGRRRISKEYSRAIKENIIPLLDDDARAAGRNAYDVAKDAATKEGRTVNLSDVKSELSDNLFYGPADARMSDKGSKVNVGKFRHSSESQAKEIAALKEDLAKNEAWYNEREDLAKREAWYNEFVKQPVETTKSMLAKAKDKIDNQKEVIDKLEQKLARQKELEDYVAKVPGKSIPIDEVLKDDLLASELDIAQIKTPAMSFERPGTDISHIKDDLDSVFKPKDSDFGLMGGKSNTITPTEAFGLRTKIENYISDLSPEHREAKAALLDLKKSLDAQIASSKGLNINLDALGEQYSKVTQFKAELKKDLENKISPKSKADTIVQARDALEKRFLSAHRDPGSSTAAKTEEAFDILKSSGLFSPTEIESRLSPVKKAARNMSVSDDVFGMLGMPSSDLGLLTTLGLAMRSRLTQGVAGAGKVAGQLEKSAAFKGASNLMNLSSEELKKAADSIATKNPKMAELVRTIADKPVSKRKALLFTAMQHPDYREAFKNDPEEESTEP